MWREGSGIECRELVTTAVLKELKKQKGRREDPPQDEKPEASSYRALLGTLAQSDLDENRDSLALAWLLRSAATPSP